MKLEYSYSPEQVRRFAPSQAQVEEVEQMRLQIEVWAGRKLRKLDRSDKPMN